MMCVCDNAERCPDCRSEYPLTDLKHPENIGEYRYLPRSDVRPSDSRQGYVILDPANNEMSPADVVRLLNGYIPEECGCPPSDHTCPLDPELLDSLPPEELKDYISKEVSEDDFQYFLRHRKWPTQENTP